MTNGQLIVKIGVNTFILHKCICSSLDPTYLPCCDGI